MFRLPVRLKILQQQRGKNDMQMINTNFVQ